MADTSIQQQVDELNRKVDLMLEIMSRQSQQSEAMQDLVEDLSIVGKDAFQTAVDELAIQNIRVDGEDIKYLVFKFLRNIKTFGELMDTLESVMDFLHDVGPIVKDAGIAATNSLGKLESEGYIAYMKQLVNLAGEFKNAVTEEDIIRLKENLPTIGAAIRNVTQPHVLAEVQHITEVLATMRMDDKADNKSLFKLMREMNKPEVRKSLSFMLRMISEISKNKV
ncbi:MAG TPA: hypothetical protein PL017_05845 [Tenuifilaceae bacterium]|nr:hypothetical protein [Tenuifilaceae bacterium]HPE17449.1 hypothetical protein [Tenuifilaceae bacterium]HPJ45602.1 hypothetical protein [Tenuifilaceae bacterium]HPQ33472.1 hypothetical protein [Tenuifilaceae bacterium]HRX66995.1 hypothetical protein [Tenuifilaceae bacterium]